MNKKLILWLLAMVTCVAGFAQRPKYKPQVHEVALQLGSYNTIPRYRDAQASAVNFVNGVRYRYHFNIFDAFRAGFFYRTADFGIPEDAKAIFTSYSADKLDLELKFGYERKYNFRKVQIFAGVDAMVTRTWIDFQGVTLADEEVMDKDKYYGLGSSAYLGVRFFISEKLSVWMEGDYYIIRNIGGNRQSEQFPFRLFPESESGLNTFSIGASYHFKKMKKSCTCGKPGR